MREIRTQRWDERLTLASRHQIKCRASHENPVLAVLSTFPGLPPAQTPGRCPSGLVTGHEGCMTGEMFLCESLCRKAGLVQIFPWGTLRAEFKRLPQFCQAITSLWHRGGADGLLPDLKIPENRVTTLQCFTQIDDSHAFASYMSFAFSPSWVIVLYLI